MGSGTAFASLLRLCWAAGPAPVWRAVLAVTTIPVHNTAITESCMTMYSNGSPPYMTLTKDPR